MKRQLSSKQTFLLKIILPVFVIIVWTAATLTLFFSPHTNELRLLKIIIPVVVIFAVLAMRLTIMRYKKVSVDDQFLYVSNYLKEIKIPVSDIADVTEVKWVRTRPVTIHLKTDSEFGRKIVFTPKFNGFRIVADNPVIAELKESAKTKIMTNEQLRKSNEKLNRYVFKFECSQTWENLIETDDERVRHCGQCQTDVFAVENDFELMANAERGRCIYSIPMRTAGIPLFPNKFD